MTQYGYEETRMKPFLSFRIFVAKEGYWGQPPWQLQMINESLCALCNPKTAL